ncbi:MAG: diguanylate cyclase [Xenococcaceae cyanobacterium MO_188.B19]|nr:diguanylate cyclase [Xenococcaceae cyanobacterium MO_188.B19]
MIEDSTTDALLLTKYFEKLKNDRFDVVRAKLLSEGLEYLQQQDFDLILLDLSLPDSSGIESIKKIQNLTTEIPIIVLTGMNREEIAIQALREGAQDYIFKGQVFGSLLERSINHSIERKQNSEKLRQSEARYRGIVEDQTELICRFLPDGTLTFVNQAYCRYFQQSSENFLGKNFKISVPDESFAPLQEHLTRLTPQNPTRSIEYEVKLPNKKVCWQQWIYRAFFRNGKIVEYQGVGRDITQRKIAENLLAQEATVNFILAETTQHIHESLDLKTILKTVAEKINQFLGSERIAIAKVENSQVSDILLESVTKKTTINSDSKQDNSEFKQYLSQLLRDQNILLNNNWSSNRMLPIVSQKNTQYGSVCLIPIVVEKKLWGLIYIEQYSLGQSWQQQEQALLRQISFQLAIAIKQAELYHQLEIANQKLEKLAVIDGLTGIANRRKFDDYIKSEWLRLAREKAPLSLILCDIDYFKLYNDTYGHQRGDSCLKQVSQAVKKVAKRPADLVARYGGEELAIILPNTTAEGAKQLAYKICLQIQALQIPHIASPVDLYVTVSLGVAGLIPDHDSSPEELIAIADANLYKAKELGRNRVVGIED